MQKRYFAAYAGLPGSVWCLFAARLVNSMGFFIAPLLTLILTQKLGLSKEAAGAAIALQVLTQMPCVLCGGRLADAFGRKRVWMGGSLAGAALYLLCGLALTGRAMVWGVVLAADCAALAAPAADALLADLTQPAQRQAAYSLLYLGSNIGMAVSPMLGGLLFADHLPLLFLLDSASSAAAVAIVAAGVPEIFCAARGERGGAPRASLRSALRRAPILAAFSLLLFLYDLCYSQWTFMLPAQFGDRFAGDGARLYSALSSVNAVTVIALTPLLTQFTRRTPALRVLALAGLFYAAGYAGFCAGGSYLLYFVFVVLLTLGEIAGSVETGAFLANHTPPECLGRVSAVSTLLRGAASALGPLGMGCLLTRRSYSAGWLATVAIALAASAGFWLCGRRDAPAAEQCAPKP